MTTSRPKLKKIAPFGAVALIVLIGAMLPAPQNPSNRTAQPSRDSVADTVTQVQMQNVDFYVDPDIALRIHHLRGNMRSKKGGPVLFDQKASFIIHLDTADVGLTGPDLSALMNKYVFNFPGSPLKNLHVTMAGSQILQKGTLHKVLDVPFEITASLSVTPDGRIQIHPTKTVILGLHVDNLMKALGLSLDKIISLSGAKGATVKGNDIYLNPTTILPPPSIEGRIVAIKVEGDQVVQTFAPVSGTAPGALAVPDTSAPNYMYYKGGRLQFGKLLMLDAEMLIVDIDQADPFQFSLDRYNAQLIEGYSITLPDLGLEVHMRDLDKLGKSKISVTSVPIH
jgi:hypothetical protein